MAQKFLQVFFLALLCVVPSTALAQSEQTPVVRMETIWIDGAMRVTLLRDNKQIDWRDTSTDDQYRLLVFMGNHFQSRMITYVASARASATFATCDGGGGLKLDQLQSQKFQVDRLVVEIAYTEPDPGVNLALYSKILTQVNAVEGPCFRDWAASAGAGTQPASRERKVSKGNLLGRLWRKVF